MKIENYRLDKIKITICIDEQYLDQDGYYQGIGYDIIVKQETV